MVTGRVEYIISSDRDEFIKAGVRVARLQTDHRMVLAVLQWGRNTAKTQVRSG